jgi:hypothetical protein
MHHARAYRGARTMELDDPRHLEGEARQRVINELVPMPEAALLAYIAAFGIDTTISRVHRNDMAERLCQLLVVYCVSEDGQSVRRLDKGALRGGIFADGGHIVRFRDKRESITGLAVTRTALKAAVAALKDTQKPTRKVRP